ncbi:hypothetical protein [Streptomyces sp. NPDC001568]|uniref:hypothetical protein n=1 Tax=Streptomyces sp. NPDC001568 TaxID=3364588 RepID=UPI00368ECB99
MLDAAAGARNEEAANGTFQLGPIVPNTRQDARGRPTLYQESTTTNGPCPRSNGKLTTTSASLNATESSRDEFP